MASEGSQQPPWNPPQARSDAQLPQLKIYNSLTRGKYDIVPIGPSGNIVTWYVCGPTVYEDAHLGHAKNYISADIIRRVMKDYFGFSVRFVMNMTYIERQDHSQWPPAVSVSAFQAGTRRVGRLCQRLSPRRGQGRIPALHSKDPSVSSF